MTMDANRGNPGANQPDTIESFVAREHWRPIAMHALIQLTLLASVSAVFAVPPAAAAALAHLVAMLGAVLSSVPIARMVEQGHQQAAVELARRSLASLIVAGVALLGLIALHDPAALRDAASAPATSQQAPATAQQAPAVR